MAGSKDKDKALPTGRLRPDGLTFLLVCLAALGLGIILLRISHGVLVNGDAKYYIEFARALTDGERGLLWVLGKSPYLLWEDYSKWEQPTQLGLASSGSYPPFYPVVLAVASGLLIDPRSVAGPLNAVVFGMTILVAGHWLRQRVRSRLLLVTGCLAVVFSAPAAWMATQAFSEALFILLSTCALYYGDKCLTSTERSSLVQSAIFTSLACLTRYSGVVLIMVVLPLLVVQHGVPASVKRVRIGQFLAISMLPLALWVLRNYLVTGLMAGPRTASPRSFIENVARTLNTLEAWNPLLVDLRVVSIEVDPQVGMIIGALLAGVVLLTLAGFVAHGVLIWWRGSGERGQGALLPVAGAFAFGYMAFMVVTASVVKFDPLASRLLVPVYIPLVLLTMVGADRLLSRRDVLRTSPARSGRGGVRYAYLMVIPTAMLVVSTIYGGFISLRDTATAVVNPEYGQNAYVYNAENIDIDGASLEHLKGRVGAPDVRSHFDLHLNEGTLIYGKSPCLPEDMERRIFLHIAPANPVDLPGFRKFAGYDDLGFFPNRQGVRSNGECWAVAPLPGYDLKLIRTGQTNMTGDRLWEVEFDPRGHGP